MILLITTSPTLGAHMEKDRKQTKWLLLLNTFEVNKLNLALLWVEDLFCEKSLTCHGRCYIVLGHGEKTMVIVV